MPLSMAFGCYYFTVAPATADKLATGEQYVAAVLDALRGIPSVESVSGDWTGHAKPLTWHEPKVAYPDQTLYPQRASYKLDATITIPQRLQTDLTDRDPGAERFILTLRDRSLFPIVRIVPVAPKRAGDASSAVVVVREFLRTYLARSDHEVRLNTLGPTPMHAAFVIEPTEDLDEPSGLRVVDRTRVGYEHITVGYSAAVFDSDKAAAAAFTSGLAQEIEIIYTIAAVNSRRVHNIRGLAIQVESLIALHRAKGIKARLAQLRRASRTLSETTISLAEYEAEQISDEYRLRDRIRAYYDGRSGYVLKDYVERDVAGLLSFPTQPYSALLEQLDARRLVNRAGFIGLLAAVIGAVVGAIVGALLAG